MYLANFEKKSEFYGNPIETTVADVNCGNQVDRFLQDIEFQ